MEKSYTAFNASLFLKASATDPYRVELQDNMVVTPTLKSTLLVPYLSSLFESLLLRAVKPQSGIPRYAVNEVSLIITLYSIFHFQALLVNESSISLTSTKMAF